MSDYRRPGPEKGKLDTSLPMTGQRGKATTHRSVVSPIARKGAVRCCDSFDDSGGSNLAIREGDCLHAYGQHGENGHHLEVLHIEKCAARL